MTANRPESIHYHVQKSFTASLSTLEYIFMKDFSRLAILVIIALCFTACGRQYSGRPQPKAVKGVLDLHDWNFSTDGPVELRGPWMFHRNQLATNGRSLTEAGRKILSTAWKDLIATGSSQRAYPVTIPHIWN